MPAIANFYTDEDRAEIQRLRIRKRNAEHRDKAAFDAATEAEKAIHLKAYQLWDAARTVCLAESRAIGDANRKAALAAMHDKPAPPAWTKPPEPQPPAPAKPDVVPAWPSRAAFTPPAFPVTNFEVQRVEAAKAIERVKVKLKVRKPT